MLDLNRDGSYILRAITGLYLALGCFWLYAAFRAEFLNLAIMTTAAFSAGLVLGRLLSFALDGWPSGLMIFYAGLELGL